MTLIGADLFLSDLSANYILSIAGQKGSGKTSMAFEIARWYLDRGYKLVTNILNVWTDPDIKKIIKDDPTYLKHSVVILDEGGRDLRTVAQFEPIFIHARKFDNIFLIPSTRIPHENLAEFVTRPDMWLSRLLPIGLNHWTYTVKTGDRDIVGDYWFRPSCIGVYDTYDPAEGPGWIIEAFSSLIALEQKKRGRDTIFSVESGSDTEQEAALLRDQRKIARTLLSLSRQGRGKK